MTRKKTPRLQPGDLLDSAGEILARRIAKNMSPIEKGRMLYPEAKPIRLADVPIQVLTDHAKRYSRSELESGQFFEVVPGKFTFIMDEFAYRRRT